MRTSVALVSRSTARSIESVVPLSDPPRGSAASRIASLLIGPGVASGVAVVALGRDGPVSHHIKKIARPMIAAIAKAA
jgi:hypothetical protein